MQNLRAAGASLDLLGVGKLAGLGGENRPVGIAGLQRGKECEMKLIDQYSARYYRR